MTLEAGVVLGGRYRLLRPIGEGGMGAVWEAEHTSVGRHVAIKVLHADYRRVPEIVERFEREARAAAAIGHDNIIDVLDVGRFEDQPFMVMEFLHGRSLAARMDAVPAMTLGETVAIMHEVLRALTAAHAAGIVHRDLKPENVFLVTRSDGREAVKLLDFGVSKFGGDEAAGGRGLTQTGALMGTPMYMAPEQALARRDIDARADVYSAGVMLFEMTTGSLPFHAESQTELLMQIVYSPTPPPSVRSLQPELPEAFEAVVTRAMSRDRDARYASAAALDEALSPWLAPGARDAQVAAPAHRRRTHADAVRTRGEGDPVTRAGARLARPVRSRRTPWLVGAMLVPIVGVVAFALRGHRPSHTVASARPFVHAPDASPPVTTDVAVDLEGLPAAAQIEVDGRPAPSTHLVFARRSTHAIRITAPGMQPYLTSVLADRDRSIVVALSAMVPVAEPVATTEHTHRTTAVRASTARPDASVAAHPGHGALLPVSNEF